MPRSVLLLVLSVLMLPLVACTTMETAWIDMAQTTYAGKPEESIAIYQRYFKSHEEADFYALNSLCAAYLILHRFSELDGCMEALERNAELGEDSERQQYLLKRAHVAMELGRRRAALQAIEQAFAFGEPDLVILYWEAEGRLAAQLGDAERARALIAKIDGYRIEAFGGLLQLGEEYIGKMRRDGKARIYLDLGDPDAALVLLEEQLPGQHWTEWLFTGAVDYAAADLSNKATDVIGQVQELSREPEEDNPNLIDEVNTLYLAGNVALLRGDHKEAIQAFRRLLAQPRVETQRYVYLPALHRLGVVYARSGDRDRARRYLKMAVAEIETSLSRIDRADHRASFLADRMAAFDDLLRETEDMNRASICGRFERIRTPGLELKGCRNS